MRSIRTRPIFNEINPPAAGPGVYGSRRAGQMLNDLAAGTDSLDVVVIGDSNTLSALTGAWGYHCGFMSAMIELGWNCYGTAIYHTMLDQSVDLTAGDNVYASTYTYAATGNLASGNASGGSTAYSVWTPATNWCRFGNYTGSPIQKDNWAYIASGAYGQSYNALYMRTGHPLNSASLTLKHRIRWGGFNTGSGSFQGQVRNDSTNAVVATGSSQSTNNGTTYSFNAYEYNFTPVGGVVLRLSPFGGTGVTGPAAFHSHSAYCVRKGWSVTSHGYLAGADSATISTVISGIGSTLLQSHLQELRERQIAAGGSGRVLLVTHSGINGNETATAWTNCHLAIWNTYKAAWAALGYPSSDLAIVSMVGVPRNSDDSSNSGASGNLIAVRTAANALPGSYPDMTIVDAKAVMPYSRALSGLGNGRSYYQRTSNLPNAGSDITVHLSGGIYTGSTRDTSDGYTVMAHEIIQALRSNA